MIVNDWGNFRKRVDEVVLVSEFDPDLSEMLKWVNTQAFENNMSFYKMIFYILNSYSFFFFFFFRFRIFIFFFLFC